MRKFVLLFTIISFAITAHSQEAETDTSSVWKTGGVSTLNFSQVSFENWAAGGENSYSLNGMFSLHANYKKDRTSWENSLDVGYGIIKQGERGVRKTDDKIEFQELFEELELLNVKANELESSISNSIKEILNQ